MNKGSMKKLLGATLILVKSSFNKVILQAKWPNFGCFDDKMSANVGATDYGNKKFFWSKWT